MAYSTSDIPTVPKRGRGQPRKYATPLEAHAAKRTYNSKQSERLRQIKQEEGSSGPILPDTSAQAPLQLPTRSCPASASTIAIVIPALKLQSTPPHKGKGTTFQSTPPHKGKSTTFQSTPPHKGKSTTSAPSSSSSFQPLKEQDINKEKEIGHTVNKGNGQGHINKKRKA